MSEDNVVELETFLKIIRLAIGRVWKEEDLRTDSTQLEQRQDLSIESRGAGRRMNACCRF